MIAFKKNFKLIWTKIHYQTIKRMQDFATPHQNFSNKRGLKVLKDLVELFNTIV